MIVVKDTVMFKLIHDFFKIYLPNQRQSSRHTIKSYRESLDALLDFVKIRKKIELYEVTFDMIDSNMISDFLDSLEENSCAVSTRNHRRNCIRAFYKYAAKMEPTAVIHRAEIYKVPVKNSTKPDIIEYMSETAVKAVLEQPDATTLKGLRDQFLMVLLYDTGARIQELMDIRIRDMHSGILSKVTVTGKWNKTRSVPVMEKTVAHYLNYKKIYHPNEDEYSEQFLFMWRGMAEKTKCTTTPPDGSFTSMASRQRNIAVKFRAMFTRIYSGTRELCTCTSAVWICRSFPNGWAMPNSKQRSSMPTPTLRKKELRSSARLIPTVL